MEKLGNEYVEGPVRSTLFESEGSIESNRSIERNEEAETVQLYLKYIELRIRRKVRWGHHLRHNRFFQI